MKKHMKVVLLLTFSFYFMVASPPPAHATDVTLTVGNGSGFPGSPDNVVEVSLDIPSAIVKGIQLDITDEGDYLTCIGCTPHPDRPSHANCLVSELDDGSCRAVLFNFDPIIGSGPFVNIKYAIKESAPAGECKNLTPGAIKASGENNQSLDAVSVPGTFCFLSCQVNGECNDENDCTDDTCNSGQCTHQCNATSPSEPCCRYYRSCISDSVCSDPSDTDHDGIPNSEDNCPDYSNAHQTNSDNDSYGDGCDNCPGTDNEDQADADNNGIGDACEDINCGDVWPPESSPGAMDCGDGVVDIYDITAEVDLALGVQPDACQAERANVPTGNPTYCSAPDGIINILDIVVLIDKTLRRIHCCRSFVCLDDGTCNDGLFCNGTETCQDGACQPGADPCPGQMCNETDDVCADCLTDSDCDDGTFCNGAETCESGTCQPGDGNPCPPSASCNEEEDVCNCSLDEDCDDDLFCNGVGTCQNGACQIVSNPCPGQMCNETDDVCADCLTDSDCDDGTFCNGAETCDGGICQPGDGNFCSPPYVCFEDFDQCVIPAVTLDIGNGSGFPGTTDNSVILNLDNPNDTIGGFQVDICDVDDLLILDGCETTGRANVCECSFVEAPDGCGRILVSCLQPDTDIQEGDGPIAILEYTVLAEAPAGECRDLNPEGVLVVHEDGSPLGVESLPGEFCFTPVPESHTSIPTTSEWGMIIFVMIMLGIGVVTILRRRMV